MGKDETLADALLGAAARGTGSLTFHLPDGSVRRSSAELAGRSRALVGRLTEWGVAGGDAIGILGTNDPRWAEWALASWLAGAIVVPLPFPLRLRDSEAVAAQVRQLAEAAGCRLVLAEPALLHVAPPEIATSWESDPAPPAATGSIAGQRTSTPGDPAVLQFTSGSTGSPKAAVLTHGGILAAIRNLSAAYRLDRSDRLAGWLPFFHDNGLFGYLVRPLLMGCEGHVLPTRSFAGDPASWFRLLTQTRATLTSGPSSAWSAALRTAGPSDEVDLSSLRLAILAAEAINPRVVEELRATGSALGLRPEAVAGAYGMAELTLGVTATEPGVGIGLDRIDGRDLATSGRATPAQTGEGLKVVPSCGRAIPGVEIRIVGSDGALPERRVGEIQVRSPSVMTTYTGPGAAEADPFDGEWLRTGDLGYLADGELFFTGRSKDIVVVMGRNYAAEDLEWAAERTPGLRVGRVVAFSRASAREGEAVIAIEASDGVRPRDLAGRVRDGVFNVLGIRPTEVLVLDRGSVPKTTSGKLRRGALREADRRGELPVLARAPIGQP
jgi:fatty-acyl-CoA synthase